MDRSLNPDSAGELVRELASLWGVETAYRDSTGRQRRPPVLAIMKVLGALQARSDVGPWLGTANGGTLTREDASWLREAVHERRARLSGRLVAPVMVAWDGCLEDLDLADLGRKSLPGAGCFVGAGSRSVDHAEARVMIGLEGRSEQGPEWVTRDVLSSARGYHRCRDDAETRLPFGYHRLRVELAGRTEESVVISAPRRCWQATDVGREWGLFVPTYALRSERDRGAGDLADLGDVMRQVASLGGKAVSTLPLLAAYLDSPFEPSPYSPVSRLFWNEFYLAVEHIQEWSGCRAARRLHESARTPEASAGAQGGSLVDYAGVAELKRRVLGELARHFFREAGDERRAALDDYVRLRPDAFGYAGFRARVEAEGADWRSWRRPWTKTAGSSLTLEQLDESGRYHLYCQWQMDEQLARLSGRAGPNGHEGGESAGAGFLLDVPVGVHRGGYDTWRWPELFTEGVTVGAPPDAFFTEGQVWGSPPLHPERCREHGHSYWRQVLRHHMRHAKLLRLDHVMSLHRLFWIPEACSPIDGVYVRYPTDELYAILCLESHRHMTEVVGEDLGTVPPGVRTEMRRHGLLSTWVLQGALKPRSPEVIKPAPQRALAALGTHDMFPWTGFVQGDDIRARLQTGQLTADVASRAIAQRSRLIARLSQFLLGRPDSTPARLLAACLEYLGKSEAELVLVDLADLVLQREPHNLPGTGLEYGNWQRRLPCTMAETEQAILDAARWISRMRRPSSTA